MKCLFFLLLFFAVATVYGQESVSGQVPAARGDSLVQQKAAVERLKALSLRGDSTSANSLKSESSEVKHQLDSLQGQLSKLQLKLDSLQGLGQGVNQLQDSLQQVLQKGQVLEQKLIQKQQALAAPLAKVADLQQQMPQEFLSDTGLPVEGLSVPALPQVSLPDVGLPDLALPEEVIPKLPNVEISSAVLPKGLADYELPDLSQQNLLKDHLPEGIPANIDSSTFSGEKIDKKVEEQLLKHKHGAALQEKLGEGQDPLKEYLQQDAKSVAQQQAADLPLGDLPVEGISEEDLSLDRMTQTAPKLAVDHFAGKEKELDRARGELNKYKGRFDEIKSLKELPKNPLKRHPLMGVKWYKRIQPGLQWQIGKGEAFRVDIGPRASYLVTDKLELGAAYQERLSISKDLPYYLSVSQGRVWGYSLFGSYEIKKGFYGQISYERLNTQMQQLPHHKEPPQERLWVEGLRLGIGKRYNLYKRIRGYSLMEYNFTTSLHAPYRQQLQVKVGIVWDRRSSR